MGAPPAELKKGLKQRHLTMIAMGGVIGAGLFVGSGIVFGVTGPGAFITYALSGTIVILVMRMLGEMATANPSTGSFADYSRNALGGWAGFSVGWLYWYFWVIIVGFEAVAGAKVIQFWVPGVPLWILSLFLMVLMTATNLFSVSCSVSSNSGSPGSRLPQSLCSSCWADALFWGFGRTRAWTSAI